MAGYIDDCRLIAPEQPWHRVNKHYWNIINVLWIFPYRYKGFAQYIMIKGD